MAVSLQSHFFMFERVTKSRTVSPKCPQLVLANTLGLAACGPLNNCSTEYLRTRELSTIVVYIQADSTSKWANMVTAADVGGAPRDPVKPVCIANSMGIYARCVPACKPYISMQHAQK
jgi:hypothetical protein